MSILTRKHMVEIGQKGGFAGRGSPAKRDSAKKAAAARWSARSGTVSINVVGGILAMSWYDAEILDVLTLKQRRLENRHPIQSKCPMYEGHPEGVLLTYTGFLARIMDLLTRMGKRFTVVRNPKPIQPVRRQQVFTGVPQEVSPFLRRALALPTGAVVRMADHHVSQAVVCVARAFSRSSGLIVVKRRESAGRIYERLQRSGITAGILTGDRRDAEAVMVITRPMLSDPNIEGRTFQFAIAEEVSKKGETWLNDFREKIQCARKFGFCGAGAYQKDQMMRVESVFGPWLS